MNRAQAPVQPNSQSPALPEPDASGSDSNPQISKSHRLPDLAAGHNSGEAPSSPPKPAGSQNLPTMPKNFRKRSIEPDADDRSDDEDTRRYHVPPPSNFLFALASLAFPLTRCSLSSQRRLEEIKYMQKLRERKLGIPADPVAASTNGSSARGRGGGGASAAGEADKEDLVLQDTFAQETAVTIEDPNMYVFLLLLCTICDY